MLFLFIGLFDNKCTSLFWHGHLAYWNAALTNRIRRHLWTAVITTQKCYSWISSIFLLIYYFLHFSLTTEILKFLLREKWGYGMISCFGICMWFPFPQTLKYFCLFVLYTFSSTTSKTLQKQVKCISKLIKIKSLWTYNKFSIESVHSNS